MFFTGHSSAGSSNGCEDYLVIIIIIIVVIDGHSFGRSGHSLNVFSQVLECPVHSAEGGNYGTYSILNGLSGWTKHEMKMKKVGLVHGRTRR